MIYPKKILPKDIVKTVKKKLVRCITVFAVLEIVAIVISVLSCEYITTNTNVVFYIFIVIFLCVIPFLVKIGISFKGVDRKLFLLKNRKSLADLDDENQENTEAE